MMSTIFLHTYLYDVHNLYMNIYLFYTYWCEVLLFFTSYLYEVLLFSHEKHV